MRTQRIDHNTDSLSITSNGISNTSPSSKKKILSTLRISEKSISRNLNSPSLDHENERSFSDAEEAITATENVFNMPGIIYLHLTIIFSKDSINFIMKFICRIQFYTINTN